MAKEDLDKKCVDEKEFLEAVNDAYQRGYKQGLFDGKPKPEKLPSCIFRLRQSGYEVHPADYEFIFKYENGGVVVTDTGRSLSKIICKTYEDDYMNGSAEFLISPFGVNHWRSDYARIHWQWNVAQGFIMINKKFCPMPVYKKFNYGVLGNNGKKELCRRIIQELLSLAYEAMKNCNTEAEFAEMMWKS